MKKTHMRKQTGGDIKIAEKCKGDCYMHVEQINVYIRYLHKVLSDEVLNADTISDTSQIVIYSNVVLINLVSYYFDHYGNGKGLLKEAGILEAIRLGNEKANDAQTLQFRASFFKWMGSKEYAQLLNRINLGCVVNTTSDMKNDYIIKIACLAYGLQIMFADADRNEVHNYMTSAWFNEFIKTFIHETVSIADACMPYVSSTSKGLQMLASVGKAAYATGKVAYATGKAAGQAAAYVAPYLGKAVVATAKGIEYVAPISGKVAWYTGEKEWYTSAGAAKIVGKIPVIGSVAIASFVLNGIARMADELVNGEPATPTKKQLFEIDVKAQIHRANEKIDKDTSRVGMRITPQQLYWTYPYLIYADLVRERFVFNQSSVDKLFKPYKSKQQQERQSKQQQERQRKQKQDGKGNIYTEI